MPTLQKLLSRNSIFDGYVSQYQMLEKQDMTPMEFERKLAELPEDSRVEDFHILQLDNDAALPVERGSAA